MSDLPPLPRPVPGRYRHYKGGQYELVDVVRHSETLEPLVLYRALYGERGLWVRPYAMFFERIAIDGRMQPRFAPVEAGAGRAALLVIDVQRALCTGEWAMHDIDAVIRRIETVTAQARAAGVPVIYIQHEEDDGPLLADSDGWQLADGLTPMPTDPRVRKRTPDAFHRTGLSALLDAEGVDRLIVCGLQSDFCVDSTVRAALALGYPVTLVADAHTTIGNGVLTAEQITAHHGRTLASIGSFGAARVTLVQADALVIEGN